MSEQPLSDEQVAPEVYAYAAEKMKSGVSPERIQSLLVRKGLDPDSAATVVSTLSRVRAEANREAGKKNLYFGTMWCVGGIFVTVASYAAAAPGGTYLAAWGAIFFGAVQLFRGLRLVRR